VIDGIQIRECTTIDEFDSCIRLQREVFGLPELEISPRRHLIVSRQAGGWTLGAFVAQRLAGFVHNMAAVHDNKIFGYSHMMAVAVEYQNKGVGAQLKWSQRERALNEGRDFIKWTWDPMQARNAYFNLNRLGVTVRGYAANFYGTDYVTSPTSQGTPPPGIDSDRLFAEWHLRSARVLKLAEDAAPLVDQPVAQTIQIPTDWPGLCKRDPRAARQEQLRVRVEFQNAFAGDLVCAGFARSTDQPRYLLYEPNVLTD
jgi:predicted GNAT superfamily acetyltransferase